MNNNIFAGDMNKLNLIWVGFLGFRFEFDGEGGDEIIPV